MPVSQRLRGFLRRTGVVALLAALTPAAATLGAQSATIVGRVIAKGTELPLGYSIVRLASGAVEQFTNADGRFSIRVEPGAVVVTARHIGYTPVDTTLRLARGDTVRLQLELSLVAIELPAVHSMARACAHPGRVDPRVSLELAALFEQVRENADRNRLLSKTFPFELQIERKITKPEPMLEARFVAYDTVIRSSERAWRYAPGKMLGEREYGPGVFAGKWTTLTMPELADFADAVFLDNHCFDYGGVDVVDNDSLLRIDFTPSGTVRSPDVAGTIYLDPKTYQLRTTTLALVNLDKRLRDRMSGQSVRADFEEAIPGVPVVRRVSSLVFPKDDPKAPPIEPSTETHRTLDIRFLKGKP